MGNRRFEAYQRALDDLQRQIGSMVDRGMLNSGQELHIGDAATHGQQWVAVLTINGKHPQA